uniref:Uncharacterized protein n=1 Tax=Glycine max TaxID=3847 RepID=A0A0R0HG91_SOYBN
MNPLPFQSPPPWFPILPSEPPNSTSFWDNRNVCDRLRELQNTLNLAKAMQKELEMLMMIKDGKGSSEDLKHASNEPCLSGFVKCLEDKRVSVESQESLAVEAANSLTSKLRAQLEPFRYVADEASPWEHAKEIANSKVLKMKAIAKSKAKEEEKKVEAGVALIKYLNHLISPFIFQHCMFVSSSPSNYLLFCCLCHFLPEEDDKFLEKVQAAVEEEEREALAAQRVHSVTEEDLCSDEKKSSKIGQISESDDPLANLPIEFYHYYHGSNNDMGTLIEVRRGWNAYIRPGGSRIPGHWVQPLPPANEIWASYLVRPK